MKHFPCNAILLMTAALYSCGKANGALPASQTLPSDTVKTSRPVYQLVWSDEFDGDHVDTSKWRFETGGGGWGNNEQEYYQAANAVVTNGNLVITAKKETVGNASYTSARMSTEGKFRQAFGRIEARIRLPLGQGLWPAFWMLGDNITAVSWPKCGELDIMEHINTTQEIYGTMHWYSGGHVSYGSKAMITPDAYHVYAIEWSPDAIRWYVDSILYQTADIKGGINNTGAFQLPFFILLNMAVGGNWPGVVYDSVLPASMYVDYVRVYKQVN